MMLKFEILAIAVLACSVSAAPHCSCPKLVRPVCGSDGRLYLNACDARCSNVEVSRPGRCLGILLARPKCTCHDRDKPVCGSDGTTYRNDCHLNCATQYNSKLHIAYYGSCKNTTLPECTCADNHSPVCGSDGVTYDNDCWLNCATQHNSRLSIVSSGFCHDGELDSDNADSNNQPECTCDDNHSPVCGSDGVTYDNDCWLNCATQHNSRLSIAHSGFCQDSDVDSDNAYSNNQPECTCDDKHSPVCGTDGVTYNNDCWLNCATQYNSRLSVAHSGFCKGSNADENTNSYNQPECTCADNHSPVCGSDGVSYDNDCWLNCATQHNSRLSIVHSGFCSEQVAEPGQNSCTCTRNYSPVCGSDGVTYNNWCLLRCAGVQKNREGPCEARG